MCVCVCVCVTQYTEGKWSKYYSPTAYPKKVSQP